MDGAAFWSTCACRRTGTDRSLGHAGIIQGRNQEMKGRETMRRILGLVILLGAVLLAAFHGSGTGSYRSSPSLARNPAEKVILSTLDAMVKSGRPYLSVP